MHLENLQSMLSINLKNIERKTRINLLLLALLALNSSSKCQNTSKPNIVIIYTDDLGWADLTCYGSTFYETPHLDRLAKEGIQFMNGYATAPVCSPSRASLMTGKYPVRTGITDWITGRQANGKARSYEKMIAKPIVNNLALEEKTIAEHALEYGYKTFIAGKWHLGETEDFWPENHGFQINKGGFSKGSPSGYVNDTTGGFFTPYKNPRLTDGPKGEYLTDRLTAECLSFLESNGRQPFLMVHTLYAVHNPMQAPRHLVEKYTQKLKETSTRKESEYSKDEPWMAFENGWKQRNVQSNPVYAAMVENMDSNVGKIVNKLKELGLSDNTLIIFTSDNGGLSTAEGSPTSNLPLRAGKGWMYEGGIKVPFITKWPKRFAAGQKDETPVQTADIFATCLKAMNDKAPTANMDGLAIQDILKNKRSAKKRALYWHYPHYSNQGGKPSSAILQYPFKLIYNHEDQSMELYDVKKDISEQKDLVRTETKKSQKLISNLKKWLTEVNATFPDINPNYKSDLK